MDRAKQKMGIDAKVIQAGLFNTTSTAQDRREMLEEIMRRGTSSLGTDVPSEREINRLAARSDEEFWMFEKMDDERKLKEKYRSRLMEDHEVPDWAYTTPENKDGKGKGFDYESRHITGKRRRKDVVYVDTLSDLQWMKAVENGGDVIKHSARGKWRENLPPVGNDVVSNGVVGENKLVETKSETMSLASEATSEDTASLGLKRSVSEIEYVQKTETQDGGESDWNGLSWKPHKKRRSRLVS